MVGKICEKGEVELRYETSLFATNNGQRLERIQEGDGSDTAY